MRVKWNRHLDLGVQQHPGDAESPEFVNKNDYNNLESGDDLSINNALRKKATDAQKESGGFLHFFRSKKRQRDDLSQCSVSSSASGGGHLTRRLSLPARLKRKVRANDQCHTGLDHSSETGSVRDSVVTSADPRTSNGNVLQQHYPIDGNYEKRRDDTIDRITDLPTNSDVGRYCPSSFSRDSFSRKTLPSLPKNNIDNVHASIYHVKENPTLTKSASLSTCQSTDVPRRQSFSNFSPSIKSLDPTTIQASSGKVNLFSAAKNFFSSAKSLNKKCDTSVPNSSKLKRSVSVSASRAKSGESIPDAHSPNLHAVSGRGRWQRGRVQSHGNVRDAVSEFGKTSSKPASMFSGLFSSFRSSLKSLDHRSNHEHYVDKHDFVDDNWLSRDQSCNVTENNSVSSLLVYDERFESSTSVSRRSLEELDRVASRCLLLPEKQPVGVSPNYQKEHLPNGPDCDNFNISEPQTGERFNRHDVKCSAMTVERADLSVDSRHNMSFKTFYSEPRINNAQFDEKETHSAAIHEALKPQLILKEYSPESIHALNTGESVRSEYIAPNQCTPQHPQFVVSSKCKDADDHDDQSNGPISDIVHSDSSYALKQEIPLSVPVALCCESNSQTYNNDASSTGGLRATSQQVGPGVDYAENDRNSKDYSSQFINRDATLADRVIDTIPESKSESSSSDPVIDTCQITAAEGVEDYFNLDNFNTFEKMSSTTISETGASADIFLKGISTLDGTIVLTDDRPIFCDSLESTMALVSMANNKIDDVDSPLFSEKVMNGVGSSPDFLDSKNQSHQTFVEHDNKYADAVASLNQCKDVIKISHSDEARLSSEHDTIEVTDVSEQIDGSLRTNAVCNDATWDVIATEQDLNVENKVCTVKSVEKRLMSAFSLERLGSRDSVTLGRRSEDKHGNEESSQTCGRHSPPFAFPYVDGSESNRRGRVRWSDTPQSFEASTEAGSGFTDRNNSFPSSQTSDTSRITNSQEGNTSCTATSIAGLTPSRTHVPDTSVHETSRVMISGATPTTPISKSAISDITGAITELQNAISSTFKIGCDLHQDNGFGFENVSEDDGFPSDSYYELPNRDPEPRLSDCLAIQGRQAITAEEFCYMRDSEPQPSESQLIVSEIESVRALDLSSHEFVPSSRGSLSLSPGKNTSALAEDNCSSDNFCDAIGITFSFPENQENDKCLSVFSSENDALVNRWIPHSSNEDCLNSNDEKGETTKSPRDQYLMGKSEKTMPACEIVCNDVGYDIHVEQQLYLGVLQEGINTSTEFHVLPNVLQSIEQSVSSSVSKGFSNLEPCRSVSQADEIGNTQTSRCLSFNPLDNFHYDRTRSDIFLTVHLPNITSFRSLDRIPKLGADVSILDTSNLWRCKSEELLPFPPRKGCCILERGSNGNETFCRLKRSKVLAKVHGKVAGYRPAHLTDDADDIAPLGSLPDSNIVGASLSRGNSPDNPVHDHLWSNGTSDHAHVIANKYLEAERPARITTPPNQIVIAETKSSVNISSSQPEATYADLQSSSNYSIEKKKLMMKKKKAANGIGLTVNPSVPLKQTSLEAVGQVLRPHRGNAPAPYNARGAADKTGLNKGSMRSRSSRIPRKQHGHEGRPIVPPKPIRPPMWLSKAELTQEIQHLSSLCETRTKELNRLKIQTKHVTRGFDALAVTIRFMSEDLNAFENPCLLSNLKQTQEKVKKEKKDLEYYEKQIAALDAMHAKEMNDLLETMTSKHESEIQELVLTHTAELNFLHEEHKKKINSCREALKASCEEERLQQEKAIDDLQRELKQQKEEVEMFHQQELDDLEERYQEKEKALREEIKKLQKQVLDVKHSTCTMEEALQKDTDSKIHWISEKKNDLQNEVDSLKSVLELKNNELHSLRKENLEMQKELEELPLAKEKIKMLQARAEDLQALMSEKVLIERQLSSEHKVMRESYEKEAKVNKRLSMENEELQWRLKQVAEQSLFSNTSADISETNAAEDLQLSDDQAVYEEEMTPSAKSPSPVAKPMFFTYMNDEEMALSSQSPRMHYKQIKPCSSHKSSAKPFKSSSTPSPRKSKGSGDGSPLCGGGTPRKVAKHLSRTGQRSSARQKHESSIEEKEQKGNISEPIEISVLGLTDSLVSSASSDNSVFEPCLLEEHGEEIRETLKLLQEQNNAEFIYNVSSPSYDSSSKWHITSEVNKNEGAAMDPNNSVDCIDPKTFYHVAFPVLKESESTQELDPDKLAKEL